MTSNSISLQLVIINWGGINATQICGLNVSPHLQLPLSQAGFHAHILVRLTTTLRTVLYFTPHLQNLLVSNQSTEKQHWHRNPSLQGLLITPNAFEHPAGTCTSVEVTTFVGHAPTKGTCTRLLLWTLLRPFILEWEVNNHPDKAFVRQLIHNLQYGCNIGYLGLQFAHLTNNLASASPQPKVIDAALQKECKAGRILVRFSHPPCQTFVHQVWALYLNMIKGGKQYTTTTPHSINDYIDTNSYFLIYCTIDEHTALGPNALLSKIDLKDTFRLIPVRPEDWNFWAFNGTSIFM